MAFTDKIVLRIGVTDQEDLEVRRTRIIFEDGEEISRAHQRMTLSPGQDYSSLPTRVQRIAAVMHTPEAVALRAARDDLLEKHRVYQEAEAAYQADPSPENETTRDAALADRDATQATFNAAVVAYEADIA